MPTRTPGHRGRQPVKPPEQRFALSFIHEYAALPAASYPVDVTGGIPPGSWGMLGNGPDPTCTTHPNGCGDCGYAGRQHYRMAKAASYGETETWETSNELVAEYFTYDHGQDNGVNLADVLLSWYKAAKILAFAPVNHNDPEAIDAAMQAFKGVYIGVDLTDDADQRFAEGLPWTTADGQQPDPSEGHCIVGVKAESASGKRTYVTWGAEQEATADWSRACVLEAWVIVTHEDELEPEALAALRADIGALHGHNMPGPAPTPPPGPAPQPSPAPSPSPVPPTPDELLAELARLIRDVAAGDESDLAAVIAWLHSHGL